MLIDYNVTLTWRKNVATLSVQCLEDRQLLAGRGLSKDSAASDERPDASQIRGCLDTLDPSLDTSANVTSAAMATKSIRHACNCQSLVKASLPPVFESDGRGRGIAPHMLAGSSPIPLTQFPANHCLNPKR